MVYKARRCKSCRKLVYEDSPVVNTKIPEHLDCYIYRIENELAHAKRLLRECLTFWADPDVGDIPEIGLFDDMVKVTNWRTPEWINQQCSKPRPPSKKKTTTKRPTST